jgi:hypothetical protein
MKLKTMSALAGLGGALVLTSSATATYSGLSVASGQAVVGGTLRNVYRVYAMFSDPNDYLTAVSGTPTLGNLVVQSRNANDTGAGSNFVNVLGGGATAPGAYYIGQNADVAYDTFVTIGISVAEQGSQPSPAPPDYTGLAPGFSGIGNVNQIATNNGGWFSPGPTEQGRAGYAGDGDAQLRVLIMQLTVSSTSIVRGTVAISGVNANGLLPPTSFTMSGQIFGVPTPGVLALLGVAGVIGSRRRRT